MTASPAVQPGLTFRHALDLQAEELRRTLELWQSLTPDEWAAPTECPGWTVADMARHVVGACASGASIREQVRQMSRAKAHQRSHGGPLEAALSAVQIQDRADMDPQEIVAALARTAPRTVRGRARTPGVLRSRVAISVDGPLVERWSLEYLTGTIYLRDLWMHRVDVARATGRELELTTQHDGAIVADVAREWALRHQQPVALQLTGPLATELGWGEGERERVVADGVELCRVLSGRSQGTGLLTTVVPF